jgi:hypothetical protein
MATKHVAPRPGHSIAVHGLEHGRTHARRHAARRRTKNTIVSGVMFVIAAGVVGGAGYYLWQFYDDEQERNLSERPAVEQRTTDELIDQFDDAPRFNGPGAPAFGIGDDQP